MGQPCVASSKCFDLDEDSMDKLNSTQASITKTNRSVRTHIKEPVQELSFPILNPVISKIKDNIKSKVKVIGSLDHYAISASQEGSYYQGGWQGRLRHGDCRMLYSNGSYFQGKMNKGRIQGLGLLIHPSGEYYLGQFKNSMAEGLGIYVALNYYYQGEFTQNKQNGRGIYKSSQFQFDGIYAFGQGQEGKMRKIVKKEGNNEFWRDYWYNQAFWKQKKIQNTHINFLFEEKEENSMDDQISHHSSFDKISHFSDQTWNLMQNECSRMSYRRIDQNYPICNQQ